MDKDDYGCCAFWCIAPFGLLLIGKIFEWIGSFINTHERILFSIIFTVFVLFFILSFIEDFKRWNSKKKIKFIIISSFALFIAMFLPYIDYYPQKKKAKIIQNIKLNMYADSLKIYHHKKDSIASETGAIINVSVIRKCLYNDHVGHDWHFHYYINDKELWPDNKFYYKFGDVIHLATIIKEDDSYPDYGCENKDIVFSKKELLAGKHINVFTEVIEDRGRYAGNSAGWESELYFKVDLPPKPKFNDIKVPEDSIEALSFYKIIFDY